MTTFLLVRHGAHDLLGKAMAGRAPGVSLNERGHRQAAELLARLDGYPVEAIYSSPQPRAQETAAPLAAKRGLPVGIEPDFDEVDFGEWTGWSFERLRECGEPWRLWVERKSVACPPGGEAFARVAERAVAGIERLAQVHRDGHVLLVSHGDVLKAVVASFLGVSLDHLQRFDIAPASLSVIVTGADWFQVKLVNGHGGPPPE